MQSMLGSIKNLKNDPQLMSILSKQDHSKMGTDTDKSVVIVRSKREQDIDDKIERLLIAYKEKDE